MFLAIEMGGSSARLDGMGVARHPWRTGRLGNRGVSDLERR